MLFRTLKMLPVEEEVGGGGAVPEHVERGVDEEEGTSMEMIGYVEACGLMSVILMSFTNSMPMIFSIIIIICRAYPQLRRGVLEMFKISTKI
jgi:hypothetical protein